MGLQEASITVKFAGGVETKMDSKSVPSARLLALENGVFTKAVSIKKRNGYEALDTDVDGSLAVVSGGRRLAARDDELLQLTTQRAYSRQVDAGQWVDVGPTHSVVGTDRPAVHTGTQQTMPDHATLNGVTVYAWEDSLGGVYYAVVDADTGAVYRAPAVFDAAGRQPRCVAAGASIHVYVAIPSLNRISVAVINPSSPSAAPLVQLLVDDLDPTTPSYDACETTRIGTPAAIVWNQLTGGTHSFRFGYVDASGVLGSPVTGHPSVLTVAAATFTATPLGIAHQFEDGGDNDDLAIAFVGNVGGIPTGAVWTYRGTVAGGFSRTNTFNTQYVTGLSTVQRCAVAITGGVVYSAFEDFVVGADASEHFVSTNTGILGGAEGTAFKIRSVGLASRAFVADSQVFAYFVHDTTYFNTYLALRLTDARCVARMMPAGATGLPPRQHVSSAHVAGSVVTCALSHRERLTSAANDKFGETGVRLLTLDFSDTGAHQTAQIGRGLYMGGACPQHYDGRIWSEQSFHVGPERLLLVTTNSGGGSLTIGTYEYRAWYEWTDAQGEVHRGAVSAGTVVVCAESGMSATLTIPTLRVTDKSNVRLCVARTRVGDATEFFRVTSLDPTTVGADNGYRANDKTIDKVTFVDAMSDVNLAAQEPLYTNGGILSNDPAPLGAAIATGKNRMFFSDHVDPNGVRHSQALAEGFGLEVAPELRVTCDPFGGDVVALAVMDEHVVVFKQTAIYEFSGDGPTAAGDAATSGFTTPRLVTSDVGCTSPTSVGLTPQGLVFKSAKGIYLLDRSLSVSYAGAPVEAYNDQDITRALVSPDRSQVVFLTSSGKTLLWDYLFNQWSTFTNHEGLDAVVVGGVYHYLRADSRVFRETIGSYSDAGVRITLRLETAWLHLYEHLQGLQRFWRMLLLGTWSSPHQLNVQYQTDFEDQWSDPEWLDATGDASSAGWITGEGANPIGEDSVVGSVYGSGAYGDGPYGGAPNAVYSWRVGLHSQGQSIRFRFEDFEKAGLAGATFELTEMLITGGLKKPDNRPFSAARST
jgi:hypothetical protein